MGETHRKKPKQKLLLKIIFGLGFLVMIYPLISRTYYDYRGSEEISHYQEGVAELPSKALQEKLQKAYAYNNALLSGDLAPIGDPFSDEEKEAGIEDYAGALKVREKIGALTIPKIHMTFPIYAGTSDETLQKGVGHLQGTSLPIGGLNSHSVLTAHRGLPENKLFTDLDKMEIGDLFFVESIAGQMAYEVVEVKVIEPTAIDELAIESNRDLVTLLTCTPYMVNSHRLLVIGERTDLPLEEDASTIHWWEHLFSLLREYVWFIVGAVVLLLYWLFTRKQKKARGRDKG